MFERIDDGSFCVAEPLAGRVAHEPETEPGAQQRQQEINCERTFFCGAYWRNGFHEDGVVSALRAVDHFEERLGRAELHLRRAG